MARCSLMHATRFLIALVVIIPCSAHAEIKPPVSLGEGFELVAEPGDGPPMLDVRKGKLQTRLGSASYVDSVHIDAAARRVRLELENWCNRLDTEIWTYNALD